MPGSALIGASLLQHVQLRLQSGDLGFEVPRFVRLPHQAAIPAHEESPSCRTGRQRGNDHRIGHGTRTRRWVEDHEPQHTDEKKSAEDRSEKPVRVDDPRQWPAQSRCQGGFCLLAHQPPSFTRRGNLSSGLISRTLPSSDGVRKPPSACVPKVRCRAGWPIQLEGQVSDAVLAAGDDPQRTLHRCSRTYEITSCSHSMMPAGRN
jgi:hypothetical protein